MEMSKGAGFGYEIHELSRIFNQSGKLQARKVIERPQTITRVSDSAGSQVKRAGAVEQVTQVRSWSTVKTSGRMYYVWHKEDQSMVYRTEKQELDTQEEVFWVVGRDRQEFLRRELACRSRALCCEEWLFELAET